MILTLLSCEVALVVDARLVLVTSLDAEGTEYTVGCLFENLAKGSPVLEWIEDDAQIEFQCNDVALSEDPRHFIAGGMRELTRVGG